MQLLEGNFSSMTLSGQKLKGSKNITDIGENKVVHFNIKESDKPEYLNLQDYQKM